MVRQTIGRSLMEVLVAWGWGNMLISWRGTQREVMKPHLQSHSRSHSQEPPKACPPSKHTTQCTVFIILTFGDKHAKFVHDRVTDITQQNYF